MSEPAKTVIVESAGGNNGTAFSDEELGALITWALALDHEATDDEANDFIASFRATKGGAQ